MKTKNILLLTFALLSHIFLMGFNDYDLDCETDFYITECIGPAYEDSEGQLFSKVTATIKNTYPNNGNPTSWPNFQDLFDAGSSTYIQWEIDGGTFYSTASSGMPLDDVGTTGYTAIFWPINGGSYPIDYDDLNKEIGEKNETSDEITIEAWIKWDNDTKPEYKMVEGADGEELKNTRMVKAKLKYKGPKYSLKVKALKAKLDFSSIILNLIVKLKFSFAVGEMLCEDLGVFTPTPSSINEINVVNEFCYSKELELDIKPTNDFCQSVTTKYVWEKKEGSGPYQIIEEMTPSSSATSVSLIVSDISPDVSHTFRVTPVVMHTYEPFPGPSSLETIPIEGNSKSIDFPGTDIQTIVTGPSTIESASGEGPIPSGGGVYTIEVLGNADAENVQWRADPPQYTQYIQQVTPTIILFSPVLPAHTNQIQVEILALGDINENCDPAFNASKLVTVVSSFEGLQSGERPKVANSQNLKINENTTFDRGLSASSPRITKPTHLQNQFSFAPNPSNGDLNLQFSFPGVVQTTEAIIYDLTGRLVFQVELQATSGSQFIDLNALNNGVYMIGLRGEDGTLLSKFERLVIQR